MDELKSGTCHSLKIQLGFLSVREDMNYMLKFPALVNVRSILQAFSVMSSTHIAKQIMII
jgi:hypothetical protein